MPRLLGASASFYLGFNLVLGGGFAEVPIVGLSIIAIIFFRPADASSYKNYKNRIAWSCALLGLALWSCFMVWFHDGGIELYEPYAKLLVGSIVAFALVYHKVKIVYVRTGLYLAALSLIYLYFFEYSGNGRFSNGMNPNKWSPLLLSYSVAAFLMVFLEKLKLFKSFALVSWVVFSFMILIAASRSSSLIFVFVTILILLFMIFRSKSFFLTFSLIGLMVAGFIIFDHSNSPLKSRFYFLFREVAMYQSDRFQSSSRYRIFMLKSGFNSIHESLFLGSGFDLAKSIENYKPSSQSEKKAVDRIKKKFGSFHNIWLDVLITQGVIGFIFLLSFFIFTFNVIFINRSVLMIGPMVAIGLNGFTESTLYMSILAGHLALAGAIFMNMDDKVQS